MFCSFQRWGGVERPNLKELVVFTLTVSMALGAPFITPLISLTRAADLYVDGATGTDAGDCQTPSCKTITYALDQAVPANLGRLLPKQPYVRLWRRRGSL